MSATVLYMSMSVDGFVTGPNERPDNGLGDGGLRLHRWCLPDEDPVNLSAASQRLTGVDREVWEQMLTTGAVVTGRQTFEMAGGWSGDHHDGVPIWVVTRHEPHPEYSAPEIVTYTGDVHDAVRRAKEAAGERDVMVHGAGLAPVLLGAGLLDEIQVHVVPVLFGEGRRLFDGPMSGHPELELISARPGEGALHVRYRVRR
ncbi:dihydrofolate reductase family protein [Luteipulveratus sp. YIM 133132]|uniref:Dihydrofolate reductase family protein n=1 Tax=Luteipulveratus flavus TaxID=3031728 RepID=A0ABT6C3Z6_9MICO|nr:MULTISPECIES: dihydrofolate reductase family protein [unclassified Luteipulveratus]MDE9364081.1 dihydrofolate reductase family protein [Luteipulveratus sp. YIM 133132]MDF8263585.1 dihydrofolate reductase family protein [Luteipulveratus sp. YIM 133296]